MSTASTGTDGLLERLTAFLDGHDSLESRGDVVDRIVVASGTHVLSASDLRQLLAALARQSAVATTPEASDTERGERLRGIRERIDAATAGAWIVDEVGEVVQPAEDDAHRFDIMDLRIAKAHESKADAEFIAAARTDVPWLLAEVERLEVIMAGVQTLAQEECESFTRGTCADDPVRSPRAPDLADQYCWSCRVRAAIAGEDVTIEETYRPRATGPQS